LSGHPNDALNSSVLRSSWNTFKDETVLMLDGREFQAHTAATGKALTLKVSGSASGW